MVKSIFLLLTVFNFSLNIMKTYYDRKLDETKENNQFVKVKDVDLVIDLKLKSQSLLNNIFLISAIAIFLVYKYNGAIRIASMVLYVSSFFIAYTIDAIIRRRVTIKNLKKQEEEYYMAHQNI